MDELDQSGATSQTDPLESPPIEPGAMLKPGWKLLLWWALANTFGAVIGAFITETITHGVFSISYIDANIQLLLSAGSTGLTMGGIIGLVEWLVLRMFVSQAVLWVLATSVGWGVALAINAYLLSTYPYHFLQNITALVIGACIGIPQSLILWQRVRWPGLWVLGNVVAWSFMVLSGEYINRLIETITPYSRDAIMDTPRRLLQALWIFGVLELITGITLMFLLRHPIDRKQTQAAVTPA